MDSEALAGRARAARLPTTGLTGNQVTRAEQCHTQPPPIRRCDIACRTSE
ncbi:hypothetical protein MMEU_3445 [Mycobacterium marinum str. Europe]|nr:hypothetical protein MMEU_3445 [Mycobacterium marinum str. Europe]